MKSINKTFIQYVVILGIVLTVATFWIISNYNDLADAYLNSTEQHQTHILELSRKIISSLRLENHYSSEAIEISDLTQVETITEPYFYYKDEILYHTNGVYYRYSGENSPALNQLIELKKAYQSGIDPNVYEQVQFLFLVSIIVFFVLFLILYRNVLKIFNKNVNTLVDDIQNDGDGNQIQLRELHDIFVTLKKYQVMSNQAERQSMVNDIMSQWQMEVKKIVHDLKNPLQRITMALDEIVDPDKSKLATEAIQEINSNLKSIRSTDLNIEINPEPLEVNEFFERINHLFYDINIDLVTTMSAELKFDEYAFQRICSNLIQNAIEAGAKNISFLFSETDSLILLDIVNDGKIIKNKEKLFIPFATTKKNGSGLGLIIILQLVHMHNGRFYLKSSDDQETVFRLELAK